MKQLGLFVGNEFNKYEFVVQVCMDHMVMEFWSKGQNKY